jgi:hypothetical protein
MDNCAHGNYEFGAEMNFGHTGHEYQVRTVTDTQENLASFRIKRSEKKYIHSFHVLKLSAMRGIPIYWAVASELYSFMNQPPDSLILPIYHSLGFVSD